MPSPVVPIDPWDDAASRSTLISVDLDYFNSSQLEDMDAILGLARGAGIDRCTLWTDHLPDSTRAWPQRKAWKHHIIWNYDAHDDYFPCARAGREDIANWARRLAQRGALVAWVEPVGGGLVCIDSAPEENLGPHHDARIRRMRQHGGAAPLPPLGARIDGLAFFSSPGYLRAPASLWHLFDRAAHFGFRINNRQAQAWNVAQIRQFVT